MNVNQDEDFIELKIALISGLYCVDKTTFLHRFVNNEFVSNHCSTIGGAYKQKIIQFDKYKIRLHLWDTAGGDRFRPMTCLYSRDAHGIIFVCDITISDSLNALTRFIEDINDCNKDYEGIICATKCDLEEERKITKEELIKYGLSQNMEVFETSAKTGKNINEAFKRLVELIIRKKEKETEKDKEIIKHMNNKKLSFNFRLNLIGSNNYNIQNEIFNLFCDVTGISLGSKIMEFNKYKIGLIIYNKNNEVKNQFSKQTHSKEDGIIFFIEINSNSYFKEIKELINKEMKQNSERIIVINYLENENEELLNEIENYALSKEIKVFVIDEINDNFANRIFAELISLILKKKCNNQIYEEFNKFIRENISDFRYALIGDESSGISELYNEYFNLNKSKVSLKLLDVNKFQIKLKIYYINELNILELLDKYKINGIIFMFSNNSSESFKKIKEYIDIIKHNYINYYESIICENKNNININDEKLSKAINNYFLNQKIDVHEINIKFKDQVDKLFIQLTYKILLKKRNSYILSEFYECYKKNLPILEYEKKLNKYLNF